MIKNILVINLIIFLINFSDVNAVSNKILFKVNNEIITSLDILNEVKYLVATNDELKKSKKEIIYEISKKSLIRQKIKEIELLKKYENLEIEEDTLTKILLNYFKRINISSYKQLKVFFEENDINESYVRKRVTLDIIWNELILNIFSNKVKIDENEIKEELKSKSFQNEYLLSEILFEVHSNENLKDKFNSIKENIKLNGFAETALKLSVATTADSGGELDWIKETSMNKKIREEINKIKVGDFTTPIVIPGGFLILKLENKKTSEIQLDLDKEIKIITQKKTAEQLNQYSTIYFNKIKKDIQINEY
tara:strand:- start:341 stop:1264 length:924 start_codon:yes stop_codon:yes gene_type:complete